ncbi:MAG: HAMP domain-containing histidine kinase [Saprospiraceae bacterium]|nr:HAMP domain-containing histidine kinase [Saprospiraceae bacterium]
MNTKIKQLALLLLFSLLSIIGLQIYYAVEVYQQKSMVFQAEVNQAFEKAVDKTNEQRLRKINGFFEEDISDTTQVKLAYEVSEEGPRLVVIDPKTGYKHLSMNAKELPDTLVDNETLIEIAVNENWKLLRNENILYWTQKIGDQLKFHSDSLSISTDSLEENMKAELLRFEIDEAFSFVKSDSAYQYDSTDQSFKINMLPVKLDGETLLTAKINNPQIAILKRLTVVFSITLIALALLFYSSLYLYRILKKQRQLSVLKDDFIDNVTHELITPTATLQLALETLEKSDPNSSSKYIDIARQHADRIATIVDNVLRSSLSQLEEESVLLEKVDLNSVLMEIIQYYGATHGDHLQIKANFEDALDLFTNKELLSTALHNVISNAIKYGHPTQPKIHISLEEKAGKIFINIEDNGMGIPKAHQQLIFEKFHRIPSSTHNVKGLGIGLYHAKMLMRRLNGDLSLERSSAKGSCFRIHLNKSIAHET